MVLLVAAPSFTVTVTVALPEDGAAVPVITRDLPPLDDEPGDTATDLQGNEVTDAVARYKFDATGSLYELHSPQTEVPRLRSPRT